MEFGQRAFGNRNILEDPRNPEMQKRMNLKIKYREGFHPFTSSVIEEDIGEFFDLDRLSPNMLLFVRVVTDRRNPSPPDYDDMELYDRLDHRQSNIPAMNHIDYSARI